MGVFPFTFSISKLGSNNTDQLGIRKLIKKSQSWTTASFKKIFELVPVVCCLCKNFTLPPARAQSKQDREGFNLYDRREGEVETFFRYYQPTRTPRSFAISISRFGPMYVVSPAT